MLFIASVVVIDYLVFAMRGMLLNCWSAGHEWPRWSESAAGGSKDPAGQVQ